MMFVLCWSFLYFSIISSAFGIEDLCRNVHCNGPNLPEKYCKNGGCFCSNGETSYDCKSITTTTATTRSTVSTSGTTTRTTIPKIVTISKVCKDKPCKRDCKCVPSCQHEDGYYCQSPSGYIGKNCDIAVPVLQCSRNKITVSIEKTFLDDVYTPQTVGQACFYISPQASFLHSQSCRVCTSENGIDYNLTLDMPFTGCGTTIQNYNQNKITVTNMVWANLYSGEEYDIPIPVMSFTCNYTNDYIVVAGLKPTISETFAKLEKVVNLKADIELCKIGSFCPAKCPATYSLKSHAVYTISETIHVTMTVDEASIKSFKSTFIGEPMVILDVMKLSCGSSSNTVNAVTLVSSGCQASVLVSRMDFGRSNGVCMSFKVPRLRSCRSQFFIHARLRVVDKLIYTSNCYGVSEPQRSSGSARARRALDERDGKKLTTELSLGPIYVVEESDGFSSSDIFPMKNNLSFTRSRPRFDSTVKPEVSKTIKVQYNILPLFVILIICITTIILLLVLCIACFKSCAWLKVSN